MTRRHDDDIEPPGYRAQKRRIRAMRRQLADHPNGLDPDCPEFTHEDVDAMERDLDDSIG